MPTHQKVSEQRAVKQHLHLKGRDYHSAKEKMVVTKAEGAKSGHKESKRDK